MKRAKLFGLLTGAAFLILAGCPPKVTTIPPGTDCFHTPEGESGAHLENRPIPAGFFAPESEPFTNFICFRGNPQNPLDTCVKRSEEMTIEPDGEASTEIVLAELDLVSCEPIVVMIGERETTWDVANTVSAVRPSSGRMTVTKTSDNGGTFEAELSVLSRLTFTPRDSDLAERVFDMGELQMQPERLATSEPVPWQHTTSLDIRFDPDRGFRRDNNFIPGVQSVDGTDSLQEFLHDSVTWGHLTLLLENEPGGVR